MATRLRSELLSEEQLRDLLVAVIAGVKAERVAKWRAIVGEIEALPIGHSQGLGWTVNPVGTKHQKNVVHQCAEIIKAEHPYVRR